jgi:ankyrin repeat protein
MDITVYSIIRVFFCLCLVGMLLPGCGVKKTQEELNALLAAAVEKGDAAEVTRLIGDGADTNSRDEADMPLIISAAGLGNQDIVRALAEAGADINTMEDSVGFTPLSMAAYVNDVDMVKLIGKLGGDPNLHKERYMPALFTAAENGQTELVKTLVTLGADPGYIYKDQYQQAADTSVLMPAVISDNPGTIQAVLDAGVDINHPDAYGDPAVNWAAYFGKINALKTLIKAGCKLDMAGYLGRTALDHARAQGFPEAAEILVQADAVSAKK